MTTLAKITVADYMSNKLLSIQEDTDVLEAIKKLLINRIPNAPVVDNQGSLVGMFSEKDAMKVAVKAAYDQGMAGKVKEYMSNKADTIEADASVLDAANMLLDSRVRCFPVYRGTDLVGIISRSDILRAISSIR